MKVAITNIYGNVIYDTSNVYGNLTEFRTDFYHTEARLYLSALGQHVELSNIDIHHDHGILNDIAFSTTSGNVSYSTDGTIHTHHHNPANVDVSNTYYTFTFPNNIYFANVANITFEAKNLIQPPVLPSTPNIDFYFKFTNNDGSGNEISPSFTTNVQNTSSTSLTNYSISIPPQTTNGNALTFNELRLYVNNIEYTLGLSNLEIKHDDGTPTNITFPTIVGNATSDVSSTNIQLYDSALLTDYYKNTNDTYNFGTGGTITFNANLSTYDVPEPGAPEPTGNLYFKFTNWRNVITNQPNVESLKSNITSGSSASHAVFDVPKSYDGNESTRWGSNGDPNPNSWIIWEFDDEYTFSEYSIYFEAAYPTRYIVQTSNVAGDANWETQANIYRSSYGTGRDSNISLNNVSATRIRVFSEIDATPYGISIWEFNPLGYRTADLTSEIQEVGIESVPVIPDSTQVSVSSGSASYTQYGYSVANAYDNSLTTRWATEGSPNKPNDWIVLEFGNTDIILTEANILWETAYANKYLIQISNVDGDANWETVANITDGNGGRDVISLNNVGPCKKARLYCIEPNNSTYNISIFDIQYYGYRESDITTSNIGGEPFTLEQQVITGYNKTPYTITIPAQTGNATFNEARLYVNSTKPILISDVIINENNIPYAACVEVNSNVTFTTIVGTNANYASILDSIIYISSNVDSYFANRLTGNGINSVIGSNDIYMFGNVSNVSFNASLIDV